MKKLIVFALVASGLISADDALDKAIRIKLEHCGLDLANRYGSDPYNDMEAFLGSVDMVSAKEQESKTKGLIGWARSIQDASIREAYLSVLNYHLENVEEAISELTSHKMRHDVDQYRKDQTNASKHAVDWSSKIPDPPCHTFLKQQPRSK